MPKPEHKDRMDGRVVKANITTASPTPDPVSHPQETLFRDTCLHSEHSDCSIS